MISNVEDVYVSEIMNKWPDTLAVFIQHKMLCIGCEVAPFHTVAEACAEHNLDEASICSELNSIIAASGFEPT